MIALLLLLSSPAIGKDPIPRPEAPIAVDGECRKTYPLRRGQPFPIPLANSSLATCSGVVVPLSEYADLLATEEWAKAVAAQYKIDTTLLEADLNWYKKKLEEESKPPPFLERPGTQRWFGRLETLVTVGVVAVGLGAAYQYGAGGLR
tara:strand:- start:221 stop:664 length:444 start_codon:yes stop_codon:yes gene_type:complete